ncbi:hypothetical protein BDF19DRAFT_239118 [Syncephalis fuscata]|nr:hypothetical protein BDF19DRAFT_239118 [Syncephalis fuscata]
MCSTSLRSCLSRPSFATFPFLFHFSTLPLRPRLSLLVASKNIWPFSDYPAKQLPLSSAPVSFSFSFSSSWIFTAYSFHILLMASRKQTQISSFFKQVTDADSSNDLAKKTPTSPKKTGSITKQPRNRSKDRSSAKSLLESSKKNKNSNEEHNHSDNETESNSKTDLPASKRRKRAVDTTNKTKDDDKVTEKRRKTLYQKKSIINSGSENESGSESMAVEELIPLKKNLEQLSLNVNEKNNKYKKASNTLPVKRQKKKSKKTATDDATSDDNESASSVSSEVDVKAPVKQLDEDTLMMDAVSQEEKETKEEEQAEEILAQW